ncbi:MAG: hypothetical protein LBI82_09485, partial [Dysgonamonadaceae bacterium]|nr:hypothetical protein [Dysgonamonadaceae bacterium]
MDNLRNIQHTRYKMNILVCCMFFLCCFQSYSSEPAVELMEKVIANKDKNRIENSDSWQFRQYEKFTLSISNLENAFETYELFRNFNFLPEYLWTSELDGSTILTVSVKEALSDEFRRNNPEGRKTIIRNMRREDVGHLIGFESLDTIYSDAFKEINIFDDDLDILMKRFVSPLSSSLATSFYK